MFQTKFFFVRNLYIHVHIHIHIHVHIHVRVNVCLCFFCCVVPCHVVCRASLGGLGGLGVVGCGVVWCGVNGAKVAEQIV